MNAVVLLGPPGAGKGTVAEVLVNKGYKHVSTGALLREQIQLKTPLGIEAKKVMDHGQFVPDEVVVEMIGELFIEADSDANILFDGFPRTLVQAQKLDDMLDSLSGTLSDVILMECPDDVIVKRITGRRTCSTCGAVYHIHYNPADSCTIDGCDITQRPDDDEATVRKRIEVYDERTAPLIKYYSDKNLVQSVDASQSIDMVRGHVVSLLG